MRWWLGFVCILGIRPAAAWGQDPASVDDSVRVVSSCGFLDLDDPCAVRDAAGAAMLTFGGFDANDRLVWVKGFAGLDTWQAYVPSDPNLVGGESEQPGWVLADGKDDIFWRLQAIIYLCPEYRNLIESIESRPVVFDGGRGVWLMLRVERTGGENRFDLLTGTVFWNPTATSALGGTAPWDQFPPLVALAHELVHAYQRVVEDRPTYTSPLQVPAMKYENLIRDAFRRKVPDSAYISPRPGNAGLYLDTVFQYLYDAFDWADWSPSYAPLLDVFEEQ